VPGVHRSASRWFLLGCILLLTGCGQKPIAERVVQQKRLVVAVLLSPSTFYYGAEGPDGFEHELVGQFARELGVAVEWLPVRSLSELVSVIRSGRAHMAAGLAITENRGLTLRFSLPYLQLRRVVVYRRGGLRPKNLEDLQRGELGLAEESPHLPLLANAGDAAEPLLLPDASHLDLLEEVEDGSIDYTITNELQLKLNRQFMAHLTEAFSLDTPVSVAWAFPAFFDDSLRQLADRFLLNAIEDGRTAELYHRHFDVVPLGLVDTRSFWQDVERRLPALQPVFESYAAALDWDWHLLAAIGYQESHWNPDAVSPTGVRGIMMLTQQTAKDFGVTSRQDPDQSIRGGAQQLRAMDSKIPPRIQGEDRLSMALAAYNLGYGHLEDARVLTQRQGGDPDRWADVRERLPLLEDEQHFETLEHGFARGNEAVGFVEGVRTYRRLLQWHSSQLLATSPPAPQPTATQPAATQVAVNQGEASDSASSER